MDESRSPFCKGRSGMAASAASSVMADSSRASRPSADTWLSFSSLADAKMPSDEMVSFFLGDPTPS